MLVLATIRYLVLVNAMDRSLEMSGDTIVSNRAERRRQKILQNADDRMRKICGGQNYHEEYLKAPSNAIANEDITPFVISIDQVHDVKRGTIWIFWFILGVMIRLVGTSKYSWGICDSSFMPDGLTLLLYPWHGAYFTTFVIKSINIQGDFCFVQGGIFQNWLP